jgi:organic radical activating enzyme
MIPFPRAETSTTPSLVVAEVFANTVQGEGPSCGRRASFVRLGGCNLSCSWCDSAETWDARRFDLRQTLTRVPVEEIVTRLLVGDPGIVVITGGEPLLHQNQDGWRALIGALLLAGVEVEVETNGTVTPTEHTARSVTRFNTSPKLTHSADPASKRIRPDALAALVATGKAAFKFVCRTAADVAETALLAETYGLPPGSVWIMPEGTDSPTITQRLGEIADHAIAAGFNLSTRLHVHCWGDEKGR